MDRKLGHIQEDMNGLQAFEMWIWGENGEG